MKNKTLILGILALGAITAFGVTLPSTTKSYSRELIPDADAPLAKPIVAQQDNTASTNQIQIALILDTSNSMDGLIDQAKSQLWNVVNELAKAQKDSTKAEISIALYEYGNDKLSVSSGYIRRVLPFTSDLDDISEKLFSLKTRGGSEFCGQAIQTSLNELKWLPGTEGMKVIYIAGNEPFTQGPVSHTEACELANQQNVTVYPIYCGYEQEGRRTNWVDCAQLTAGTYMNIDSDIKTIAMATPYDDQIDQLNFQLNNTYIYYGSNGRSMKMKQERQDANQESYSKANKVSRVLSKSSAVYNNGSWDLLDAYNSDTTVLTNLDKGTLPDSLKNASDIELKKMVLAKNKEREKIKADIAQLGVKRAEYISNNKTSSTELTLGDRMVKTIQTEAEKNGFVMR